MWFRSKFPLKGTYLEDDKSEREFLERWEYEKVPNHRQEAQRCDEIKEGTVQVSIWKRTCIPASRALWMA